MKNILLVLIGALLYKFALHFSLQNQFLLAIGSLVGIVFVYDKIKETKPVLLFRKKTKIILLIICSIPENPAIWALLLIFSIPFTFVHDGDNKYMFEWIDNSNGIFMSLLKGFGPLVWFVSLIFFCITLFTWDEGMHEKEVKEIENWYEEKIRKV